MIELPLIQTGAIVSLAISNDEDHPASNVIDGNNQTFWTSTGLFPQSLTISFPNMTEIKEIKLNSFKIRHIIVEKSTRSNPIEFELVGEKSCKNESAMQQIEIPLNKRFEARHVRFVITEAYDSFIAIQHIKMELAKGSR